jgi:hypothetical protein
MGRVCARLENPTAIAMFETTQTLVSLRIKLITWEQFGDGAFATASVRSP